MANNYTEILALANKNNMGLSNTIKRDYGIPLDYSSVQETYEAALNYAKTSTLAYIGQPIAVGDTLYIVTDEANGYLKEVGSKPTGDNKSISVAEDGTVSIYGFAAAGNATLPRKKADGTIEWVAINQIVANDRNTVTTLQVAEDSALTITATEDAYDAVTDTYKYVLDVTLPAIPEYSVTKEVGADKVTYKLTKDGVAVGEAIEVHNAYDDTALAERVSDAEAAITAHDGRLDDVEEKVDTFFAAVENPDEIVDTLAEIQKYIADDKTGASGMAASIKENKDAIDALNGTGDGSVKSKIDAAISAKSAEDAGKYATQDALAAVSAKADAAAVKSEVEDALEGKADAEDLANYYTKNETYTKQEIGNLLDGITGGSQETAASVKRQLDDHIADNTNAFANITKKDGEQDTAIEANTEAIEAINDETTGIYARAISAAATTAQNKVNALAETTVAQNTSDISAINSQIEGINGNVTTISGKVGTLETKTSTLESGLATEKGAREALAETVGSHGTDIAGLKDKDTELASAIAANTNKFDNYSTTTEVATMISDAIDGIDNKAITDAIAANAKAISDEAARADEEEKRIAGLVQKNTTDIAKNASDISALETAINAVIENEDGTALNSIKELAVWVTDHESEVLPAIEANTTAIATLKGTGEGSIQKIVADAIDAIPDTPIATMLVAGLVKSSNEVTVAADGAMSIGQVSTDKLVQGSETLVLNGGNAGVAAQ